MNKVRLMPSSLTKNLGGLEYGMNGRPFIRYWILGDRRF
jgi:hypothetical protein